MIADYSLYRGCIDEAILADIGYDAGFCTGTLVKMALDTVF